MGQSVFIVSSELEQKSSEAMDKGDKPSGITGIQQFDEKEDEFPLSNIDASKGKAESNPKNGKVTFGGSVQITEADLIPWSEIEEETNGIEDISKLRAYVIIDVGGERFQANRDSFLKHPNTRLGKLMKSTCIEEILSLCEEFIPGNPPEYFFDKNPENFSSVLEMYRSGNFHIPDGGRGSNFYCTRLISVVSNPSALLCIIW